MKKFGIGIIALVALAAAAIFVFQKPIGASLFTRAVEQNIDRDTIAGLEVGLHVGLCGTGSPMANLERAGACNIVIAGEQIFVVDVGEGASRNIALMGINQSSVESVFLTHFHSDHIDGMGPMMLNHWVRGSTATALPVYGPTGVSAVVDGFNAAYATDNTYRTAHHGESIAPSSGGGAQARPFEMESDSIVVLNKNGLKITAFKIAHEPVLPAVGYRFDYKGRSACISGDTAKSTNLERVCKGVDVLVHEALQPAMIKEMGAMLEARGMVGSAKIMADIQDYHASPEDAAESAETAGAKMLVLSHLVPPLPMPYLYPAFLGDAENRYDGPLIVGEDGMMFTLPADGDSIERSELL